MAQSPSSQSNETPTAPAAPHLTRGFLFADLRDYTGFVEIHGDRAGAALLARYRALVRGVVATAQGAEIRTEGDSFYVVFDAASAAVGCGLAIIEAAGATAGDPDPIRVGVGVHAGETTETPEGFVGSAVNLAARLCSEAKAGELVVSETVRGLTRTQLEVAFQPLGARHLKGVPEPVACYRVVAGDAAVGAPASRPAGRRPSGLLAAGLGLALLVAVAAAGVVLLGGGRTAAPTPGPAAAAGVSPAGPSASPGPSAGGAPAAVTSPSSVSSASASPGPFPDAVEAAILAALPSTLAQTCVRGGTPDDAQLAGFTGFVAQRQGTWNQPVSYSSVRPTGSRGGITCHPSTGAARLFVMAPTLVGASVEGEDPGVDYLGRLAAYHHLTFGSCASLDQAYETWSGPNGSGTLACMNPYDGRPWIYFSFNRGKYLGFATRDDSNYAALYQWWEQLKIFLP